MTTPYGTVSSEEIYSGKIFSVHKDQVYMPGGNIAVRDVVRHLDAVAVVALRQDDKDRNEVALVRQYRHPMGDYILELPAGLMDGPEGETPVHVANRELFEETGIIADEMRYLCTIASSPGFTDERVHIYQASGLYMQERPEGRDEEADMSVQWVNLLDAVKMINAGEIISAHTVAGILAAVVEVWVP